MGFRSNHIQIDGSLNVDGSIFQFQTEFTGGGGGGGGGDVGWNNGSVGSDNQLITAIGDGSIGAETNLTFDGTSLEVTGALNVSGDASIDGTLYAANSRINPNSIELNAYGVSGDRYAYIDFHGDDTYTDYALRIIRENTGANAQSEIIHRGTGELRIVCTDGAILEIETDTSINGKTNSADGFETKNFEIVYNSTADSLDFNYIG